MFPLPSIPDLPLLCHLTCKAAVFHCHFLHCSHHRDWSTPLGKNPTNLQVLLLPITIFSPPASVCFWVLLVVSFILLPQPLLWSFNNSGFWSDLQEEFEVLSNKTNLRWVYLQNWRPAKKKKGKIHGGQIVDFLPRWFIKASWLFSFKNSNESQYVHALFCLKFITTFWGKYFHFSDEEI